MTVIERATPTTGRRALPDLVTAVVVVAWVPVVLLLDSGAELAQQRILGLGTWGLLLALLAFETTAVRAQAAVVVVFASLIEYTFSAGLGVYVYRLDNVPSFVPPGHGLVYLAALALGRSAALRAHERVAVRATVVAGGLYALWGLSPLAPRTDVLGAFWYLCLVGFLAFGRNRLLYVGAFLVVTYLELVGTALGTWTWQPYDPTGLIPMGNPPSGAAGGYGWFDLAAMAFAPWVVARGGRFMPWAGTRRRRSAAGAARQARPAP
ncbi:MAG TPA: hypothetical protein VEV13_07285 [Candidatus Limnocylindria bacterium]|nr:hypothetical protein [Candidatus Limnocylindria bacterium]